MRGMKWGLALVSCLVGTSRATEPAKPAVFVVNLGVKTGDAGDPAMDACLGMGLLDYNSTDGE